jgi:hypothetical protein
MDDEASTRILDAVGRKFIPANLDLDGLRADIQLAAWWWRQITGEKNQPARLRRLQDIRRAAVIRCRNGPCTERASGARSALASSRGHRSDFYYTQMSGLLSLIR